MSKALAVLKREYLEVVRKKSFIIMTLIFPFLMAAMMFIPDAAGDEGDRGQAGGRRGRHREAAGRVRRPSGGRARNPNLRARPAVSSRSRPKGRRRAGRPPLTTEYVAASGDVKAAAQPYLDRLQGERRQAGAARRRAR